jgi:hypothetical protein
MRIDSHTACYVTGAALAACQVSSPPEPASAPAAPQVESAAPPAPAASAAAAPASAEPSAPNPPPASAPRKFSEDVEFLSKHGAIKVLESPAGGRIAISGKYQARIMTSAVEANGASLGWINRSFIEAGKTGTAFDNYGGEDRFWLGPEGGQYALYFPAGKPFEFATWQTPRSFQEGEWLTKEGATATSVTFTRSLTLSNYAKTEFVVDVERKLSILGAEHAKASLGLDVSKDVKWVGFASKNSITNRGKQAWKEDKGLPSIWILGMFTPAPGTRVVAPFEKAGTGEVVNDRYFGKLGPDRLQVNQDKGFALFKCDGQFRSKIGLSAARAKNVIGSYSAEGKLLTIVRYSKPAGAKRYVNNLWELSKEPYGGDVNNAYNDGPVEPGKPSLGGIYELESSSPAAALAPGASLEHLHETFHFIGPREALDAISLKVLGVSLADVEAAQL